MRAAPSGSGRSLRRIRLAFNGLRVLVVDNDRSILDAMQALLEQWGIRVFKAHAVPARRCS
jgi:PleD family two-component response regulator